MPKLNKRKTEKIKHETAKSESDSEDDLHYKPRISHHSNFEQFLQLFHVRSGSLSEEEAGNHSGNEGFIEDDIVGAMTIVEEGTKCLMLSMLGKNFSKQHFEIFFLFLTENKL